ncbi:DUF5819 family protein [Melghirimyces algeriensis]|uniref:Uncharacterized protein n=1 Tax=Melghirimyces algeriensis TaxID=910412 RepID=A0A521EAL2_9BACL|nr:DUF5819 family protein [Melghirimyces algeriensis]SMO80822.1 hypothetical protein SAMN06264849_108135 [Melghirimyces algeriensis]
MLQKAKKYFLISWVFLMWGGLLIHFALTSLYLTPNNPLKENVKFPLYFYMESLFSQNWKLFAPNPTSQNASLELTAKVWDESHRKWIVKDWVSITNETIRPIQTYRLNKNAYILDLHLKAADKFRSDSLESERIGRQMLQSIAIREAKEIWKGQRIKAVRVRAVYATIPPYEKRDQKSSEWRIERKDTGWMDYSPQKDQKEGMK